jgi:hypothetical protein
MAPVFEYTRSTLRTSRPLRHTGFAIRGAHLGYLKRLFEFMDTLDPKVGSDDDRDRITKLLAGMGSPYHPSHEQREKGRAALSRVLDGVRSRGPAAKNSRKIMFFSDHCCAPLCSRVLSAMSKWLSKLDRQFRCPVLHGCDVSEYDSGNCAGALGALRDNSCFYKLLILNVFLGLQGPCGGTRALRSEVFRRRIQTWTHQSCI